MKIAFLTRRHERTGSSRIRVLQYLTHLHALQIETAVLPRPVSAGTLAHGGYLARALRLASWADVVFVQKPNQSKRLIDILMRLNRRMIIDIDDAVWCPPLTKSGDSAQKLSKKFHERFVHAVERSNFVITGSEYLAEITRNFSPGAYVTSIPSSVDLDVYTMRKTSGPKKDVTIGWVGNPGNFVNLHQLFPVLRSVCSTGNVKIQIISSKPPDFDGLPFEFHKWSTKKEVDLISTMDIGIMPIDDDERSRGRCGYKAVQYMAMGVPVVTTPIGAGAEIVRDGTTGFHASNPSEWYDRLRLLIEDSNLRHTLGLQGRQRVESCYSVQRNVHCLVDAFRRRMKSLS